MSVFPNRATTAADRAFIRRATLQLAKMAREEARPNIPSRQLRRQLKIKRIADDKVNVSLEPYWAYWVHEGRGAFSASQGKLLIWFRNPRNDPRLRQGRSPNRRGELRKLTKQEFAYWSRKNREAKRAGRVLPMNVARSVGPVKPSRFFTKGMRPFGPKAKAELGRMFHEHALSVIRPLAGIKDEATFDL